MIGVVDKGNQLCNFQHATFSTKTLNLSPINTHWRDVLPVLTNGNQWWSFQVTPQVKPPYNTPK